MIDKIRQHLERFDFDVRETKDARFMDQKVTPDVLSFIAECILNLPGNIATFTVKDIWDSEYFEKNTKAIFGKPSPIKNGNLQPEEVKLGSGKKVWWVCEKGHIWQARVADRKKHACPYCSGRFLCKENSLFYLKPDIAKDWHPTNNGSLTPKDVSLYSHKKAWWLCKKEKAIEHCKKATEIDKNSFTAYLNWGVNLDRTSASKRDVLKVYETAEKVGIEQRVDNVSLGKVKRFMDGCHEALKENDQALNKYKEAKEKLLEAKKLNISDIVKIADFWLNGLDEKISKLGQIKIAGKSK